MANDRIIVDRSKQQGNALVRLANLIEEASDLADNLDERMQRQWDGEGYSTLETHSGVSTGTGANLLTLLGLVKGKLADSVLKEFTARVAGQ